MGVKVNMKRILIISIIIVTISISGSLVKGEFKKIKLREVKLVEELVIGKEISDDKVLFYDPTDIRIDNSNIYVLDIGKCSVLKFDKDGNFILSFGKKGQGPGELNSPESFVISNKKVYIANSKNGRIEVFNIDGSFDNSFKVRGEPREICTDNIGNLYIHFLHNNFLVHKYREDGKLIKSFVPSSDVKDPFLQMFYNQVEISIENNELFVAYKFLNKIEKYNTEGKLILTTEIPLLYRYELPKPIYKGEKAIMLATALVLNIVCKNDFLYVLTPANPKDIAKVIIHRINNRGKYLDSFYIPIPAVNLTFDSKGSMYIINSEDATIHRLKVSR